MHTKEKFEQLIAAVENAGLKARAYFDAGSSINEIKHDGSVVTEIDKAIEVELIAYVREHFPEDSIVGEEGGSYQGTSQFTWHIDPIDGTDNFLRRIPFCALSVARLGEDDEGTFALVHNPITKQTFSSYVAGEVREGELIHTLTTDTLGGRAMVSIARGNKAPWMKSASYNIKKELGLTLAGGDSFRCCALEHAYVAANRIDGVLTFGLNTYDYAAGLYLIQTAGGSISVFENGAWRPWKQSINALCDVHGKTIFSSHAGIHDEALAIIGDPQKWGDT